MEVGNVNTKYFEKMQLMWFYFRLGHTNYWGFALSLLNFALIVYGFLISEMEIIFFNNPLEFAVILTIIYIPLNTFTGFLHRKLQLKIDSGATFSETPQIKEILYRLEIIEKLLKGVET